MATRSFGNSQSQSATTYINKKGINELFEAMMTALMVNKPDDHIAFIRECLDKVQNNPQRLRWDFFVTTAANSKGAILTRPSLVKNRQKALPPVRTSSTTSKPTPKSDSRTATATTTKAISLPPIENHRKPASNPPIVFILSPSSSTKLCSKLLERYNQVDYLSINDIANIDENEQIDWKRYEHRFDTIIHNIEQRRSNVQGFLLSGHLDEKNFGKQWLEKLERIDLIILLSTNRQPLANQNLNVIYINLSNDFDTILAKTVRAVDQVFPLTAFSDECAQSVEIKSEHLNLPIIFCMDNHRLLNEENPSNATDLPPLRQRTSLDEEFAQAEDDSEEEESNNSFISTLCQRLAEQFSYRHIHYGESHRSLMNFEQLKSSMMESMSTSTGFIIDHFPTSSEDLQKFQNEIGPCAVLLYVGEHQTETKDDELNVVVEKFKQKNKAIYIDSRMEVDEIYEELKNDILKHI